MAVMFLAVDNITDLPLFREYQAGVRPVLAVHPHEVVAYDEAARPLEGVDIAKRVVATAFRRTRRSARCTTRPSTRR